LTPEIHDASLRARIQSAASMQRLAFPLLKFFDGSGLNPEFATLENHSQWQVLWQGKLDKITRILPTIKMESAMF
jgi:hypothetical protein